MSNQENAQYTCDDYHDLHFRSPGYGELVDGLLNMFIHIDSHPDTIDCTNDEKHAILVAAVTDIARRCRDEYIECCDNCEAFLLPIVVTEDGVRRYWCKDCQRYQKYDSRGERY